MTILQHAIKMPIWVFLFIVGGLVLIIVGLLIEMVRKNNELGTLDLSTFKDVWDNANIVVGPAKAELIAKAFVRDSKGRGLRITANEEVCEVLHIYEERYADYVTESGKVIADFKARILEAERTQSKSTDLLRQDAEEYEATAENAIFIGGAQIARIKKMQKCLSSV